jgi:hypothetical protein
VRVPGKAKASEPALRAAKDGFAAGEPVELLEAVVEREHRSNGRPSEGRVRAPRFDLPAPALRFHADDPGPMSRPPGPKEAATILYEDERPGRELELLSLGWKGRESRRLDRRARGGRHGTGIPPAVRGGRGRPAASRGIPRRVRTFPERLRQGSVLWTCPDRGATGARVPVLRHVRISRFGVLGLLLVVISVGTSAGGLASPLGGGPGLAVAGNGPCVNASSPSAFSGQLTVEGGPLPASAVSNVTLSYSFFEEATVRYSPNGTLLSTSCTEVSATTATDANGGFSFSIVLPGESCEPVPPSGEACTTYSGPYVPIHVAPVPPTPAGYGLSVAQEGTTFHLTWVAELAALSVTPNGSLAILSSGAPGTFSASPETANGSASPLAPDFNWTLDGTGWRFAAPPEAGTATVEGAVRAGAGNLTVQASASVNSTLLSTPIVRVRLEAVSTSVVNGSVNRTVVDTGDSVGLSVEALGAVGYSYSAHVDPGLGQVPADVACSSTPGTIFTVHVRCAASLTYPNPGNGSITVNVTNGYSSAVWSSSVLTVDPAPALVVSPSPLTGYAGAPISVMLAAQKGSGTSPYATACFAPALGPTLCSHAPGPSWSFQPTFQAAGNCSATAWTVDATGTNSSTTVEVHVLDPLAVGSIVLGSPNVSVGIAVTLSSAVEGGDLPGRLWWNVSDLRAPLQAGPVGADGPVSVEFTPPAVGTVRVSLSLLDALGTVAESTAELSVTIGPATSVALSHAVPALPTVVGSPIPISWEALNAVDDPVASFAAPATVSVETPNGTPALSWLNGSATGPLSSFPEGTFAVPSSAWAAGYLNLTVTPTVAGALTLRLGGPQLPGGPPALPLVTAPDSSRLRVFDPTVVTPGAQTNRTYWHVSDRFGNPVPGAYVVIQYLAPGTSSDQLVSVDTTSSGTTGVWVNYSLPDPSGEIRVLDRSGDLLLGPLHLAVRTALAPTLPAVTLLIVAASLGAVGALTSMGGSRRGASVPLPDEEEEARRLAEGRGAVLEVVRAREVASWVSIQAAWNPEPPPPDLDDWVASLVADGTLLVRFLPDETAEFYLAPERPQEPRVTVDEAAFDRAVARRDAAIRDGESDDA